jgi:hypothetical protein
VGFPSGQHKLSETLLAGRACQQAGFRFRPLTRWSEQEPEQEQEEEGLFKANAVNEEERTRSNSQMAVCSSSAGSGSQSHTRVYLVCDAADANHHVQEGISAVPAKKEYALCPLCPC